MNTDTIPEGYLRVTEILSTFSNFSHIDPTTLQRAADRGTRVHKYCELHSLGLFLGDVDDDCKNYVDHFQRWFDDMVATVLRSETRMNSTKYRISGGCDLIAILKGDTMPTIIDIKTPASSSLTWQLQTAAYQILAKETLDIDTKRRICLMLPKMGNEVKIVEYVSHQRDQELFLKLLELHRFFKS